MSGKKSFHMMKKDGATKAPEHPPLTEEKKLKETFSPGKSGGSFALPLGGRIIITDGIFVKKDSVTCRVVPASERWRHSPIFPGELLTSEIFILSGSSRMKQKQVILLLPYYPFENEYMELNVKGMWKDEFTWVDVGFIERTGTDTPMVELQIERMGTFAVTIRPKTDQFEIDPNGALIHSRLSRGLTIRFPKKSIDSNIIYNMKIEPIPEERIAFCKEYFPQDCHDLLVASHFMDLMPDLRCDFRRPTTLKMPLPDGVEVEGDTSDDIVVLHKELEGWQALEPKYKFTRFSVSVDVKNPTKFIVVKTKPGRQKKMQSAVAVLEERVQWVPGQINVFLSLKNKSWMGFVEVYPLAVAQAKVKARQDQGFTVIHKVVTPQVLTSTSSISGKPPPIKEYVPVKFEGIEIYDGLTWTVEMEDDLQFGPESDLTENDELRFFQRLPESYRRFKLVPSTEKERGLRGVLVVKPVGVPDPERHKQLTLSFLVEIPEEAVKKYHYLPVPETEPEPEPVKSKQTLSLPEYSKSDVCLGTEEKAEVCKVRAISINALKRLSQVNRRISVPDKEAKVISGKSLMILSKVVNEGLTLAVHLDLPESTITGIGFDALSNNRSMSEVGYRILLYWKRTRRDKRDGAVHHLVQGLRSMGKQGVANIVEERHKENKELTMDCFLMAAVSGVNIST